MFSSSSGQPSVSEIILKAKGPSTLEWRLYNPGFVVINRNKIEISILSYITEASRGALRSWLVS
jgi:hypothetical protein